MGWFLKVIGGFKIYIFVLWMPYATSVGANLKYLIDLLIHIYCCSSPPSHGWLDSSTACQGILIISVDIPPGPHIPVDTCRQICHVTLVPPLWKRLFLGTVVYYVVQNPSDLSNVPGLGWSMMYNTTAVSSPIMRPGSYPPCAVTTYWICTCGIYPQMNQGSIYQWPPPYCIQTFLFRLRLRSLSPPPLLMSCFSVLSTPCLWPWRQSFPHIQIWDRP